MIRVARERPDLLRGEFVSHLRGHLVEDPFNERLLATLIMVEAHGGDRRRALQTLRQARDEFVEIGLELSAEVTALESDLLDPDARTRFEPLVPDLRPPIPTALADMRVGAHVGHRDELAELEALVRAGTGQALIHGPSGVGKSRLCAELADRSAKLRVPTVYLRPERHGSDPAFAPLLRSLEGFRTRALPLLERPSSPELRSLLLVAGLQELTERAGDRSLLLIVDDSQLLDSATAELVRQLPYTDVAARIILVVVATERDDEPAVSTSIRLANARSATVIDGD
ncbi:MAG: AAA family ATPase, partial [Actinomycetota bacterium]